MTRTLDDWATVFNLAIVVLPDRPEGASFVPDHRSHLRDVRRQRRPHDRVRADDAGDHEAHPRRPRSTTGSCGAIPSGRSSTASDSNGSRRSCTCARTRRSSAAAQGWSPTRVAEGRRRDRPARALDVTDRVRTRRSAPDSGLADRQLTLQRFRADSSALTWANVPDVTVGTIGCLASFPMSRRSVRPHRGGVLLRARHLTLGLALGLALGATTIAIPAGATPQSDLASKTAQAKRLEAQIEANSDRADILDEQYLRRRTPSPTRTTRSRRAERGIAAGPTPRRRSCARGSAGAPRSSTWAREAVIPLGMDATERARARLAREVRRRRRRDRQPDDRPAATCSTSNSAARPRTSRSKRPTRRSSRTRPATHAVRSARANAQIEQLLGSTKSDIRTLADKIETRQARRASKRRAGARPSAGRGRAGCSRASVSGGRRRGQRWRRRRAGRRPIRQRPRAERWCRRSGRVRRSPARQAVSVRGGRTRRPSTAPASR